MNNATEKPRRVAGMTCPLFKKDVSKVCHSCDWYVYLRGENPNTGKEVDEWGCAIPWLVVTTIETTQQTRLVSKEINILRNVVAQQQGELLEPPTPPTEERLINGRPSGS